MPREIVLEDGGRIRIEGRPAQGARHEVLFGVNAATGHAVVVKVEGGR